MPQRSSPDVPPSGTGPGECRHEGPLDLAAARVCARRTFLASGGRLRPGELAARLGVSRATLFRRVGGRDELLVEVLWSLTFLAVRSADRASPGPPGAERVASVVAAVAGYAGTTEAFCAFVRRDPERALRLLTTPDGPFDLRLRREVARLLCRDLAAAAPTAASAADLARLTVRVADSMVFADLVAGRSPDPERVTQSVAALLRPPDPPGRAEGATGMRTTTRSDRPPVAGTGRAGDRR